MCVAGTGVLSDADCVVPVPLHPWRRLTRGFNQAADLAARLDLPVVHALWRTRATAPQTGLTAVGRRRNVRGAFSMSPLLSRRVRQTMLLDGVVVLVDDVRTTGATLEACAQVLKAAGVREVRALTVALAESPGRGNVTRSVYFRGTTWISKSRGHSLPVTNRRLLPASCAMPFSTASGVEPVPRRHADLAGLSSRGPVPSAGEILAIRSVCHTFAYTSPRTNSSSLRSRTRSPAVGHRDPPDLPKRLGIEKPQLIGAITEDEPSLIVSEPPSFPRVAEGATWSEAEQS